MLKPRNRRGDFETQITKPELPVLRPKPKNPSTLVLRPNQETCAPRLHVHSTNRTRCHPTSRLSDHRVPDLCLIIPGPLHQVSYSCHDSCHCPPCHTCHLHTTRQANAILHMYQDKGKNHRNVSDSNSNHSMSMTHHNQTKIWSLGFSISPLMSTLTRKTHSKTSQSTTRRPKANEKLKRVM
jgi:hypothetical protein